MRWMVRSSPDLQIYDHLLPEDLYVPLTKENANVAASLGVIPSASPSLWRNEQTAAEARQKVTAYAKSLFPQDPAKLTTPFSCWAAGLNRKPSTYAPSNRHWIFWTACKRSRAIHGILPKDEPIQKRWEKKTALTLLHLHIPYGYETISFPLPNEVYTPDFILEKTVAGRKIILEPHFEMTKKQARKYALFKRTYGHKFLLILLLKNDLIPMYHQRKILTDDVCDDVWPIEFIHLLAEKIRRGTYGT
jgi:hypothetical protein